MTQVHEATKEIAYELVFGQPPRSLMLPDATKRGVINEEDICLDQDGANKEEGCDMAVVIWPEKMASSNRRSYRIEEYQSRSCYTHSRTLQNTHTDKTKEGLSETTENKEHNVLMADAEENDLKPKPNERSHTVEDKEDRLLQTESLE